MSMKSLDAVGIFKYDVSHSILVTANVTMFADYLLGKDFTLKVFFQFLKPLYT